MESKGYLVRRGINLLGLDGEMYRDEKFGPLGRKPRVYKTWAGAECKADQLQGKVTGMDERGQEFEV